MFNDWQLAFRRLTKAPAFTVIAVMTLALAIGANTAIFSIADAATQLLKRIAEAQLYEVDVRDPATLVAAASTVLAAALFAAYLPARRASRTDPATVLRSE